MTRRVWDFDRITPEAGREAVALLTRRWRPEDLAALPRADYRYEILDGALLVTPADSEEHQSWCAWAHDTLRASAPPGWRVHWNLGLALEDDRLVPDLLVLSPDAPGAHRTYNPVTPALVVEVESDRTRGVDRTGKHEAYAFAGIRGYWRIERTGVLHVHRLRGFEYTAECVLEPGGSAVLDWPYPVTVTVPEKP
ncbi:Uma2 family endonuclease [Longispora urticae]